MELAKYNNLVPSDIIEGLEIPEHWRKIRFRHLFTFDRGLGITKANLKEDGVPCVNYGEIHSTCGFEVNPTIDQLKCVDEIYLETNKNSLLEKGDFVFADTSEDLEGSGNFTYLNSDDETFAGYHTVIAKLRSDDNPRYLAYLFNSEVFRSQVRKKVSGVKVYSITQAILKSCYTWSPSLPEQKNIVTFLDKKSEKINDLITKNKKVLQKLAEQRLSAISEAITEGLDKNVEFKSVDGGFLGNIPKHWTTRRLKFHATEQLKYGANEAAELTDKDLPRYIRITDVKPDGSLHEHTFRSLEENIAEPYLLEPGDILLARSGATVGKSFIYDSSWGKSAYAGYLIRFRTNPNSILAEFAYYYLNSSPYWANINSTLIQATIQNFSAEKYANILMPEPPLSEQVEIIEYLKKKLNSIDEMAEKVSTAIDQLKAYQAALVNSAITGQIDLRKTEFCNGN